MRAFIGMYTFLDLTRPADAVTALLIHWIGSALYAEYVEAQLVRLLRGESCAKPTATVQLSEQQQAKLGGSLVDIEKRDEEIVKLKEQYETLQRRHEVLRQQSEAKEGPALEKEEYKGD
tara:strand:- start:152 stop:508 length:357 start_codon:yes stop_codon:yes gene_type:complete